MTVAYDLAVWKAAYAKKKAVERRARPLHRLVFSCIGKFSLTCSISDMPAEGLQYTDNSANSVLASGLCV